MVTLLPIFAFGLIIALSLIITRKPPSIPPWGEAATGAWAIIILYVNITSYSSPKGEVGRGLLLTTATQCLIETYHGLHLVEVVGDFRDFGIEQGALGLNNLKIGAGR